jgi:hypothetical protein
MIQRQSMRPCSTSVSSTARSMPPAISRLPLRAVRMRERRLSPTMKSAMETSATMAMRSELIGGS